MLETLKAAIVPSVGRRSATIKAREYEAAFKKFDDRNYRELGRLYRALARGFQVISINKCMEIGGVKADGCPVLAIANAKAKWVWFERDAGMTTDPDRYGVSGWSHPMSAFISDFHINPGSNLKTSRASWDNTFRFNRNFFPIAPKISRVVARVPIVPPLHLPADDLGNYQILWEADWEKSPVDPLLLKRLTREFFIVIAKWDLSPIERMVLELSAFQGE